MPPSCELHPHLHCYDNSPWCGDWEPYDNVPAPSPRAPRNPIDFPGVPVIEEREAIVKRMDEEMSKLNRNIKACQDALKNSEPPAPNAPGDDEHNGSVSAFPRAGVTPAVASSQCMAGDGKAGGLGVTAERLYEMLVHGVATGSLVEANYCQRVISHLGGKEADRLRTDNARLRERVAQLEKAREHHFYISEKQINDLVNDNDEVD